MKLISYFIILCKLIQLFHLGGFKLLNFTCRQRSCY